MKYDAIDLNLYRLFYTTANSKSFTEASQKLNITQPAVSQSIKILEEYLKVKLFNRNSSGIDITKEGMALLYYVEKASNLLLTGNKMMDEFKNKEIFEINIGAPTHVGAYYLMNYLKIFKLKYPNVKINIIDKKTSEMIQMLEKKELDLLIDTDLTQNSDKDIKILKLKDLQGMFICNSSFEELSKKNIISAQELILYPVILPNNNTATRKMIDSFFKIKNVSLNPIIETNSSPIAKNLIESGFGIGWMIYELVENEVKNGKLFKINVDVENVKIPISVAYREKFLNKTINDFINIFKNN
ncbi:MAG: LysR family transcriptional regulator [Bacilli bacterium]|nr:LysR family transcriptional regulator [Bacilli bacterium]